MKPLPCPRGHEAEVRGARRFKVRCSKVSCGWRLVGDWPTAAAAVSAWNEGRICAECSGSREVYRFAEGGTVKISRCRCESTGRAPSPLQFNAYISDDFTPVYPVGNVIVVLARTPAEGEALIRRELRQAGIEFDGTVREQSTEGVVAFLSGDY